MIGSRNALPTRQIARRSIILAASQVARSAALLVTTVIVARTLGVSDFGVFATVVAILSLFGPFAGFGLYMRASKDAAGAPDAIPLFMRTALFGIGITFLPMGLVAAGIKAVVVESDLSLAGFAALAFSELVMAPVVECSCRVLEARERPWHLAGFRLLASVSSVSAVLVFTLVCTEPSLDVWAWLYVTASVFNGGVVLACAVCSVPEPFKGFSVDLRLLRKGVIFGASSWLNRINADVDKLMLTAIAGPAVTGVYSIAYRLASTASIIPSSVVSAASPRIIRLAAGMARPAEVDFPRVLRMTATTGIAAGVVTAMASPVLAHLLGKGYEGVVACTMMLSLLPFLLGVRYQYGLVLIGAERNVARMHVFLIATAVNVVLNLTLIPHVSVYGAIASTLVTETFVLHRFRHKTGAVLQMSKRK